MAKLVLIDSGPLVAMVRRKDRHHAWAKEHFAKSRSPFTTCEAVVSEAFFLLERAGSGKDELCNILNRGAVRTDFSFAERCSDATKLIQRYANVPMSFADACLVLMSERADDLSVFTTDGDFTIYRRRGRQAIPLIAPF